MRIATLSVAVLNQVILASALAQPQDCSQKPILVSVAQWEGPYGVILPPDAFRLESGAMKPVIRSVTLFKEPAQLTILMDVSPRMMSELVLNAEARTVIEVVRSIPADWQIKVVLFSGAVESITDVSANRELFPETLTKLVQELPKRSPPGIALFDAIKDSIGNSTPRLGDAVLVITGGRDDRSKTTVTELRQIMVGRGIRLFIINLPKPGLGYHRIWEGQWPRDSFGRLVELTGGTEFHQALETVPRAAKDSAALIASTHVVNLGFETRTSTPTKLTLNLTREARKKWKNVFLFYPREVLPCAAVMSK